MGVFGRPEPKPVLLGSDKRQVAANRAEFGVCGNCRFAFRPDAAQLYKLGVTRVKGAVSCGQANGKYRGDLVYKPFGTGCNYWQRRTPGQPTIGDPSTEHGRRFNVDLVKYAQTQNALAAREEREMTRQERIVEGGWSRAGGIRFARK